MVVAIFSHVFLESSAGEPKHHHETGGATYVKREVRMETIHPEHGPAMVKTIIVETITNPDGSTSVSTSVSVKPLESDGDDEVSGHMIEFGGSQKMDNVSRDQTKATRRRVSYKRRPGGKSEGTAK